MSTLTKEPLKKERIASAIKSFIEENKMVAGDRLLPIKQLSSHFGANHLTIRSALDILEKQKLVIRRPGSGTFVNQGYETPVVSDELIGMLIHSQGHNHEDLANELHSRLYDLNKFAVIFPTDSPHFSERLIGELINLKRKGCERLIINQAAFSENLLTTLLNHPDLNFSQVVRISGNQPGPPDLPGQRITFDYPQAYRLKVNHLKSLGHERIALLVGTLEYDGFGHSNKRFAELYSKAMIEANLAEHIQVCVLTDSQCLERLKETLQAPNGPTALIGDNDWRGIRALEAAKQCELKVPEHVSIVGSHNTPWSRYANMTTVNYDLKQYAALIIDALMKNDSSPIQLVEPTLIVRSTTGVVRKSSRS